MRQKKAFRLAECTEGFFLLGAGPVYISVQSDESFTTPVHIQKKSIMLEKLQICMCAIAQENLLFFPVSLSCIEAIGAFFLFVATICQF